MKNFKTLFLSVCFIGLFNGSFSQDLPITKNAFYFELFGNGGIYSINYERNIHRNIYCRIGFATWQVTPFLSDNPEPRRITTDPLIVSYLSGYKNIISKSVVDYCLVIKKTIQDHLQFLILPDFLGIEINL